MNLKVTPINYILYNEFVLKAFLSIFKF